MWLSCPCSFLRYFCCYGNFLSARKSERRRCGTHHTEQHLLRSLARRKSLTSPTQRPHRSDLQPCVLCVLLSVCVQLIVTVKWSFLIWFLSTTVYLACILHLASSLDGEVGERRAAESVRAAGIARKEVQWSRSRLWLSALERRHYMEVSHINFFSFVIQEVLYLSS